MPHAHHTLCAQLIADSSAMTEIPAYTNLEDIIEAVAWNAKSQATQRKILAAKAYLAQPQGANATEKRKHISSHLVQYFTKVAEDAQFRLLLRVFRITGEHADAAVREDRALAAISAWAGAAPPRGQAFRPIQDLSTAVRADLANKLGLPPAAEEVAAAITGLLEYMVQPEEAALDEAAAAPPADFWQQEALLLEAPADAPAHPGEPGHAPALLGLPPPPAVDAGQPHAQPGNDAPPPGASAAQAAAAAGAGHEYDVLMAHRSGAPALAVTRSQGPSRMTTVLRKLSAEGSISQGLLLQLVVAVADCNEPAGVGTCTATRDFLFDAEQRVGNGGGPTLASDKASTVWSDPNMLVQGSGSEATPARTLLSAVCAAGSFSPDIQLPGGSAARCLIIDAATLDRVHTVSELNDMGHGCDRAMCDLCQRLFDLVDNSPTTRQLLRPGMDQSYRLYAEAFRGHDRAVIRSGVEAIVSRARQLAGATSRTRRDRLIIVPLLLVLSRDAVDTTIWLRVQSAARSRGVVEPEAARIVWQAWLAQFVGSAELPLFFDKSAVADWVSLVPNRTLDHAESRRPTQPAQPQAASAAGPTAQDARRVLAYVPSAIAAQQPDRAPAAKGGSGRARPTAYSCSVCGMQNHHTVDCFKLQDSRTTEEELRAKFQYHQFRLQHLGIPRFVPSKSARDPPAPSVDDSWDDFARRAAGRKAAKRKRAE